MDLFQRLADESPRDLLPLLADGALPPHLLTYAAEIAGCALPGGEVVPPLLRLLDHASPVVREGAIYGLADHATRADVNSRLADLARSDASPGVRAAAADMVER